MNKKPPPDQSGAIAKAEREVANLTDAIASGALRNSPALAARLQAAEVALARLKAPAANAPRCTVQQVMPRLVDEYRQLVDNLG